MWGRIGLSFDHPFLLMRFVRSYSLLGGPNDDGYLRLNLSFAGSCDY